MSGPYDLIIQEASWGSFPWRRAELLERAALCAHHCHSIASTAFPWPEQAVRLRKDGGSAPPNRRGCRDPLHRRRTIGSKTVRPCMQAATEIQCVKEMQIIKEKADTFEYTQTKSFCIKKRYFEHALLLSSQSKDR